MISNQTTDHLVIKANDGEPKRMGVISDENGVGFVCSDAIGRTIHVGLNPSDVQILVEFLSTASEQWDRDEI